MISQHLRLPEGPLQWSYIPNPVFKSVGGFKSSGNSSLPLHQRWKRHSVRQILETWPQAGRQSARASLRGTWLFQEGCQGLRGEFSRRVDDSFQGLLCVCKSVESQDTVRGGNQQQGSAFHILLLRVGVGCSSWGCEIQAHANNKVVWVIWTSGDFDGPVICQHFQHFWRSHPASLQLCNSTLLYRLKATPTRTLARGCADPRTLIGRSISCGPLWPIVGLQLRARLIWLGKGKSMGRGGVQLG